MAGDYDHVLVTVRCSRCARPVSASYGEVRATGLFTCLCGTSTRARRAPTAQRAPLHAG